MRPLSMPVAVDMLSDLLDGGYTTEEALRQVTCHMSKTGSRIKIEKVIKEFKRTFGMDLYDYEFDQLSHEDDDFCDEELLELFECVDNEREAV